MKCAAWRWVIETLPLFAFHTVYSCVDRVKRDQRSGDSITSVACSDVSCRVYVARGPVAQR